MKTLLILLLMLGGICQAQSISSTLESIVDNQKGIVKILDDVTDDIIALQQNMNRNARYDIDKLKILEKCIDSLEKRVTSLEKMVKVLYDKHIQDSLYYHRLVQPFNRFPQLDSIMTWPLNPGYYVDTTWYEPNIKIEQWLDEQEIYRIKKRKSR